MNSNEHASVPCSEGHVVESSDLTFIAVAVQKAAVIIYMLTEGVIRNFSDLAVIELSVVFRSLECR